MGIFNAARSKTQAHRAWGYFLLLLMGAGAGCGDSSNLAQKDCLLPDDQSESLNGRWPLAPVPVAFHDGDFNSSEISAITAASQTWNSFYQKTSGIDVLEVQNATSTTAKPSSICSQAIIPSTGSNPAYTGAVVIYKPNVWAYPRDVIALTSFCPVSASPVNRMFMAIMEVNYLNFFTTGKQPDLQSLFAHEFGHLLGLAHSCEGTETTGIPGCDGASSDYTSALMFPAILFPNGVDGEIRRNLKSNDQGRANCLYGNKAL